MKYFQEQIALGSTAQICLVSGSDPLSVHKLYRQLWLEVFQFEKRFSRFLPDSELSILNRSAGRKMTASQKMIRLLKSAQKLCLETKGIYNPFVLPALQAAGYVGSMVSGYENDPVDNYSKRAVVDISMLEIGSDWVSIPYGSAIDLGGCGKGFLADSMARKLSPLVDGFWVSLGGDVVYGGYDEGGSKWQIKIEMAGNDKTAAVINSLSGDVAAVATSGTGARKNHLIDVRTLKPARTDILAASVCHKSCLKADAYASCAVILGSAQGPKLLKEFGVKDALFQTAGMNILIGDRIAVDDATAVEYNNA